MTKTRKITLAVGTVAALILSLVGGRVVAQTGLHVNSSTPNFGVINLAPGFTPDPHTTSVVSGGSIDGSAIGLPAGCGGWVSREPDVVLNLSGRSSTLKFFVRSQADTTLIINDGSGTWRCNDDVTPGNTNPLVTINGAPAGHYDIWVGSYQSGQTARGTLHITELASQNP